MKTLKKSELRHKAEQKLESVINQLGAVPSEVKFNISKLIHELEVHQIELEMQNDELREAQIIIEKSKQKYIDLFDYAPVGYFTFDEIGKILDLNLTAAKLFGEGKASLINKNFRSLIVKDYKDNFYHHLNKVLKSRSKQSCELKLLKNSKTEIYGQLQSIIIIDKETNDINIRTILTDITQLKLVEEELLKAKEKAEESDRLKTAFLANMSHEIRTPMNGILGFADLLKDNERTKEEQQRYVSIISKSGLRMLAIINDIIDISKIESGQMEINKIKFNINDLINNIYFFFKQEAKFKGLKLSVKLPLPIEKVIIENDKEKIYAVLSNLIKNSIKYSDKGTIEIGYTIKGEIFEFYVKDNGLGIAADQQKNIFERFVQADASEIYLNEGSGLGLSISKAYIEMLGGKIWVESVKGVGSQFYFTLPYITVTDKENSTKNEVLQNEVAIPFNNLKILIAEDEEISEEYITIIVRKLGKEIINAKTGVAAVEVCRNNPDIDLVLMDIQMPEMDGYKATSQIRKFNKDVIIIAQTAYAMEGDEEKSIAAGCNDYISKPINKQELFEKIEKHLRKN